MYTSGWMCLYSGCSKFWRCGVDGPMPQTLAFNPEFLQLLDEPVQRAKHEHLKPGLPVRPDDEASKLGTGIDFTRGWHCSDCGRLSCRSVPVNILSDPLLTLPRYRWKCWECPCCHVCDLTASSLLVNCSPEHIWGIYHEAETYRSH